MSSCVLSRAIEVIRSSCMGQKYQLTPNCPHFSFIVGTLPFYIYFPLCFRADGGRLGRTLGRRGAGAAPRWEGGGARRRSRCWAGPPPYPSRAAPPPPPASTGFQSEVSYKQHTAFCLGNSIFCSEAKLTERLAYLQHAAGARSLNQKFAKRRNKAPKYMHAWFFV